MDQTQGDLFGCLIELCHISSSQEEIFRKCLVVETNLHDEDDAATTNTAGVPVADVVLESLQETQDGRKDSSDPQDVLQTSHEPSQHVYEFEHCTINRAVFDDSDEARDFVGLHAEMEEQEFVNSSRVSDHCTLNRAVFDDGGAAWDFLDLGADKEEQELVNSGRVSGHCTLNRAVFDDSGEAWDSVDLGADKEEQEFVNSDRVSEHCTLNRAVFDDSGEAWDSVDWGADTEEQEFVNSGRVSEHCTLNRAVFDDSDEALGFVDLGADMEEQEFVNSGRDSELGFSDVELVAECLRGVHGADISEVSNTEFNKFRSLERELSLKDGLGEPPLKKLVVSGQNLGFDSSEACADNTINCEGILASNTESPRNFESDSEPQDHCVMNEKLTVELGNEENTRGGMSVEKYLVSHEKSVTHVVQSEIARSAGEFNLHEVEPAVDDEERMENCKGKEKINGAGKSPCIGKGRNLTDKGIETSERQKKTDKRPGVRILPSAIHGGSANASKESPSSIRRGLQNAAKELLSRTDTDRQKRKEPVCAACKLLSENRVGDSLETESFSEAGKIIKFPRPRWWPDKGIFKKGGTV